MQSGFSVGSTATFHRYYLGVASSSTTGSSAGSQVRYLYSKNASTKLGVFTKSFGYDPCWAATGSCNLREAPKPVPGGRKTPSALAYGDVGGVPYRSRGLPARIAQRSREICRTQRPLLRVARSGTSGTSGTTRLSTSP